MEKDQKNTNEIKIAEFIRDVTSVVPRPKSEVRRRLDELLEDSAFLGPMGVSQWRKYGKRYGYWDYFKKDN